MQKVLGEQSARSNIFWRSLPDVEFRGRVSKLGPQSAEQHVLVVHRVEWTCFFIARFLLLTQGSNIK